MLAVAEWLTIHRSAIEETGRTYRVVQRETSSGLQVMTAAEIETWCQEVQQLQSVDWGREGF